MTFFFFSEYVASSGGYWNSLASKKVERLKYGLEYAIKRW